MKVEGAAAAVTGANRGLGAAISPNYLFFPRTPEGKRAAKGHFGRLEERTMVASSHPADMARRLPDARLTIYPDAGHGGIFQHHQRFVPEALAFLNGSGETTR